MRTSDTSARRSLWTCLRTARAQASLLEWEGMGKGLGVMAWAQGERREVGCGGIGVPLCDGLFLLFEP